MSEGAGRPEDAGAVQEPSSTAAPQSAGARLRHIRESAGIDAAIVASALKISPQTLDALEHDRYEALPDLAFARSLAASICRNFGVDPGPVLAQMPQVHAAELPMPERGINAPFHGAGDRPMALLPKYISRPLTVVVALFLLGSLLLWLWPTLPIRLGDAHTDEPTVHTETLFDAESADEPPAETPDPAQQPDATPAPGAALDAAEPAAASEPAAAEDLDNDATITDLDAVDPEAAAGQESSDPEGSADEEGAQDAATADEPGDAAADAPPAADPDADVSNADDATTDEAAAVVPAADDLVIEASGESWVSVRDASGKTLVNRLLEAGESERISGAKPLSATIGRKEAVTVRVHGEPFDHRALSSSSVSRFKVN